MSDCTKKNEYETAVGLQYNENDELAPYIAVKGDKLVADEIIRIAKKYNIPIVEDAELASSLKAVELDSEIPEELFQAVAIILHRID